MRDENLLLNDTKIFINVPVFFFKNMFFTAFSIAIIFKFSILAIV